MCGIFGAFRPAGGFGAADWQRFERATDLVAYRGPDDRGSVALNLSRREPGTPEQFDTFLGHRRLSIIDLSSAGHQPMTDGAGCWIVFNGEIFNYVELREELRATGCVFRSGTDTEVVLHLYARYGEAGFDRLNGMWAFALVDLPRRRLLLSRDRFAIKPLYWTRLADGTVAFGSEIKQLLPFAAGARLNAPLLAQYLGQALADHTTETMFRDVHQVPAKHNLLIAATDGQAAPIRYWDYRRVHPPADPGEAIAQFRDLFLDSVRIRLRSDVDVGALVSGGLDSSSIAVATNAVLGASLSMFSVVGDDPAYSEERFIDTLAASGVAARKIPFDSGTALDRLDTALWHNDEPFLGLHAVAQFTMLERIRAETGIKVILSGQGGDECLLGYHKFFFFHLQRLVRAGQFRPALVLLWQSWRRGTVARQFRLGEARRYLPVRRWRATTPYLRIAFPPEDLRGGLDSADRQRLDIDRFSVPVQTHFEDRNSMGHSLEIRTPFLDHRLVDFALGLPPALKLKDGWSKYVLRASMPELPDVIRWRRDKQGFLTPEEQWLRGPLRGRLEALGRESALADLGVIDPGRFLRRYRQFLGGRGGFWYADLSRVFIAETWVRRFGVAA